MKTKFIPVAILMSLLLLWSCGPTYPYDNNGTSYPIPEISDATLGYNSNRQILHCELSINYDSLITDLRATLELTGFTASVIQTTLNDSGQNGDAIARDNVFSRNIALTHIDSLDGRVIARYDIYENGISIKSFTDSLDVIANLPPVITEIIMPDTLYVPRDTLDWFVYVDTDDPDGSHDVSQAYCQVFSNSRQIWSDYPLYDDGTNGDERSGDGIFSTGFILINGTSPATYYFRFRAKDTASNFSDWSLDSVVVR